MHGNVGEYTQDCAIKKKRLRLRKRLDLYKLTDEPQFYIECEWIHVKGYSWISTSPSQYRQEFEENNPDFPRGFGAVSHQVRSSGIGIRIVREL